MNPRLEYVQVFSSSSRVWLNVLGVNDPPGIQGCHHPLRYAKLGEAIPIKVVVKNPTDWSVYVNTSIFHPHATPMTSNAIASELEELLKVVGEEVIQAYRDKYFPARILQACPTVYSLENASKWVNFDKFCTFVAHFFQEHSPPPSPSSTRRSEPAPSSSSFVNRSRKCSTSTCQTSAADRPTSDTEESDNGIGGGEVSVPQKRKRGHVQRSSSVIRPSERKLAAGLVQVTRQSWVNRVETLTEVPEHWRVPELGDSVAYIMDLSRDSHDYQDNKGKNMAMSAIIKQKCTDAWAGGTGGSVTKATTVTLLGEGVKCQKMSHDCRGAFLCARAPTDLWKDYKRGGPDSKAVYLFQKNTHDTRQEEYNTGHFERPVAFYNSVVKDKCQFDNGRCPGRVEFKQDFLVNQGDPFIGCSAVPIGCISPGHIFRQIPKDVDEGLLVQMFSTGRVNHSDTVIVNGPCTFTVPPRTGLKQKYCPHVHVEDGKIVEAVMQQRPCPAKITIFSPIDHSLRRAVVIPAPGIPHNHPFCPWDKRTRRAKAAARAAGHIMDQTSGNIDRISHSPSVVDDSSNPLDMVTVDPSNPALLPGSSIATALVSPNYHLEQFYS